MIKPTNILMKRDFRDRLKYKIYSNDKVNNLNQKRKEKTIQYVVLTRLLTYKGKK